jgi:protein TonB
LLSVLAASSVLAAEPKFAGYEQAPTGDDLAKYYPEKALDVGKEGAVVMKCTVQKDRTLGKCAVSSETAGGYGFGDAALQLSKFFKMKKGAKPGSRVTIPIQFQTPG